MADDTRQKEDLSKGALTVHPENKAFTGAQWQDAKQQTFRPPENANLLAGGTEHTAGGKMRDVTVGNAFENGLKMKDFTDLPKRPCVRDALMTGIGSGFALGSFRAIFGASVWRSCNWAVGGMCLTSGLMYQWCLHRRQAEKEGMMRAVEILNKKEVERRAKEQQKQNAKEERRRLKEQEQDQTLAALRESTSGQGSWWKFW